MLMITNEEMAQLSEKILFFKSKLERCPKGKLLCGKNGIYMKYYIKQEDDTKRILNTSRDKELLSQLILKEYYELKIKDLESILNAEEAFCRRINNCGTAENFSAKSLLIRETILKATTAYTPEEIAWSNMPQKNLDYYPDKLTVQSACSFLVRSKSEGFIASSLFKSNILFRYEDNFYGRYPDFTILHPATKQKWIWEHLGKMDDEHYFSDVEKKMEFYFQQGYYLGENLILTAETKNSPLNNMLVEKTIESVFLSGQHIYL